MHLQAVMLLAARGGKRGGAAGAGAGGGVGASGGSVVVGVRVAASLVHAEPTSWSIFCRGAGIASGRRSVAFRSVRPATPDPRYLSLGQPPAEVGARGGTRGLETEHGLD